MTEILPEIFCSNFDLMILSWQNYVHVTTAELLWHVQNCDLIESLFPMQGQYAFFKVFNYGHQNT